MKFTINELEVKEVRKVEEFVHALIPTGAGG